MSIAKSRQKHVDKYTSDDDASTTPVTETGDLGDIIPQSRLMVAVNINKLWYMQSREFGVSLNVRHALVFSGGKDVSIPCDIYLGEDDETGQEIEKVYIPKDKINTDNKRKLEYDDVIGEGFVNNDTGDDTKRPRLDI